jgi:hypothetical protein
MRKIIFLIVCVCLIASCNSAQKRANKDTGLKELTNIMQCTNSSEKQSVIDTSYYNISLRMVQIWKKKAPIYT